MIFLRRLRPGDFDRAQRRPDPPHGWKVYGLCESDDPESLCLTTRAKTEKWINKDTRAALGALQKLVARCDTGQPLNSLFDEKQCHWAFEVNHCAKTRKKEKVWRLWVGGIVRLYFCYGPNRELIVAWALRKREDDLKEREERELNDAFRAILAALESGQYKTIDGNSLE